ncbi:MAG: SDR family NAD(P)-dependent oxidoreductase, partial [Gammaproteobacteria bacterium]
MEDIQPQQLKSLARQRVVLFGGTSGIGFAVAQRAMAEGAEVVLASSNPAKVKAA